MLFFSVLLLCVLISNCECNPSQAFTFFSFKSRGRGGICRVCLVGSTLGAAHQQNLQLVPDGTRSYAMVPGSRITSRVPSSEIQVFPTILCAVFAVSDGTRWYPTVPERALDHFADAGQRANEGANLDLLGLIQHINCAERFYHL